MTYRSFTRSFKIARPESNSGLIFFYISHFMKIPFDIKKIKKNSFSKTVL